MSIRLMRPQSNWRRGLGGRGRQNPPSFRRGKIAVAVESSAVQPKAESNCANARFARMLWEAVEIFRQNVCIVNFHNLPQHPAIAPAEIRYFRDLDFCSTSGCWSDCRATQATWYSLHGSPAVTLSLIRPHILF